MFRTKKCNHGDKGRCINCLAQQIKVQKKNQRENGPTTENKCVHPPNMKCLKCMGNQKKEESMQKKPCSHPDFESCIRCKKNINYDSFQYYLQKLQADCPHKKPCNKCVPLQSRKTFTIDKNCKKHLPYPQAQCDACMAPTISLTKQSYVHVKKVIICTSSIHRIVDTNLFGILLGYEKDGIVFVEDVYFPPGQIPKSGFLDPQILGKYVEIFDYFGKRQVGIIYSSSQLNPLALMLSSMFQQQMVKQSEGHPISQFVTMRLHYDEINPYFECFMVSDQFQALHKYNLLYETEKPSDYFDLITAKNQNDKSSYPTFLREGIETDEYFFKQIVVWIETIFEESYLQNDLNLAYPFFTIDNQSVDDFQMFLNIEVSDPLQKYRNIQFILHLDSIFGRRDTMLFLNNFIMDGADLFLREKLYDYQEQEKKKQKMIGQQIYY